MPATLTPPAASREIADQEQFDADVTRYGRVFLEVLAGAGVFAAVIMSTAALLVASHHHPTTTIFRAAPAAPVAAVAPPAPAVKTISLSVAGGVKRGPDGKMHDA